MVIQTRQFKEAPKVHKEIVELGEKVEEKRKELLEKKEAEIHDKELIRQVLEENIRKTKPVKSGLVMVPKSQRINTIKKIKTKPRAKQVQLLIDLAFEKGVIHATDVAKKLDDPYILDEFHDALVDKFYDYLVKQGKLEKIS